MVDMAVTEGHMEFTDMNVTDMNYVPLHYRGKIQFFESGKMGDVENLNVETFALIWDLILY